jgi:nitrilase
VNKLVSARHETIHVATIQAPQMVFNKEKSIKVVCKKIKETGEIGAKLVVFPKNYIPT